MLGLSLANNTYTKRYMLDGITDKAIACYAPEKLYNNYTGPLVRVCRLSDNAEMDIYANATGKLDTVALLAFCNGADAEVVTWYDQSGNGNHANAYQAVPSNRAKIVSSGVYVDGISFDGNNDYFNVTDASKMNITSSPISLFCKLKHTNTASGYIFARDTDLANTMQYGLVWNAGTLKYELYLNGASRATTNVLTNQNGNTNVVGFVWKSNGDANVYLNGSTNGSTGNYTSTLTTRPNMFIGARYSSSGLFIGAIMKYLVIFNTDITSKVSLLV